MAYASSSMNMQSTRLWRQLTIFALLTTALLLVGCKRKSTPTAPPVAPNEVAVTEAPRIMAQVGNQTITADQVEPLVEARLASIETKLTDQPAPFLEQRRKAFTREVTEVMVVTALLEEQVKAQGISVTDEEMTERLNAIGAQRQPALTAEAFLAQLGEEAEDFQNSVRLDLAIQKLFAQQFEGKTSVNDAEIEAFYKANTDKFSHSEQVRVSHIQIPASNRSQAESLLAQLQNGGDFAALAQAQSQDKHSAAQGGDVGFFGATDMEAPFAKAAFALESGQVSDIVETSHGLHIIKLTERRPAKTVTLDEARDQIRAVLINQQMNSLKREYIQSLREKADVRLHLPQ